MTKADADTTTPQSPEITVAALAAALGEIEASDGSDLQDAHFGRLDILRAAAEVLPVRTADDATLALSVANDILGDVKFYEYPVEKRHEMLSSVTAILAQAARWLTVEHGAPPLRTTWPYMPEWFRETAE